jgi:sigma-B regulation protein RsbU (phosphoserine phosphatase)
MRKEGAMSSVPDYGIDKAYKKETDRYLDFQLGHIAEKILLVDKSLPLTDALAYFTRDKEVSGIAVEEQDKVIGVLSRDVALDKASSRIEVLKGKNVKAYLQDDTLRFDASDFCEKAFSQVIRIEDRKINNLIIYEGNHFLGIVPANHLILHVNKIREMAYEHARYIQQFFLDKSEKKIEGIEFADFIRMAHQIGGDFYHVRRISDTESMFACFDVASKDIAASLTTGLLSSFFSMYFSTHSGSYDAKDMVRSLNSILVEQTPPDIFVVALVLSFDTKRKVVRIFNHGYSPLYVCVPAGSTAKLARIKPSLMPLGINKDIDFDTGTKELAVTPLMRFFLCSDGLLDAMDGRGNRYGDEKIKKFVMSHITQKPDVFMKELVEEYDAFTKDAIQVDDFTAIMIEVQ